MLLRPAVLAACLLCPAAASAQWLPDRPIQGLDGRLVVGGEAVLTGGSTDDEAFFNYTGYERNALRIVRAGLSGMWRPLDRLALVGEVRAEAFDRVRVFAAYLSVRPWASRRIDIQAGRIPPVFGSFARRAYAHDSPLIGYPLAYQYLTSLRPDAAPGEPADLIRMRGRGWRVSYPLGNQAPGPGVPLVDAFRWDTGVQVRWLAGWLESSAAITTGTLSNPRVRDDNGGPQFSARVAGTPVTGLVLGASAARGPWLADSLQPADPDRRHQTATGLDAEYSRDRWLVRAEAVFSRWDLPDPRASGGDGTVRASAAWMEGRYRISPRIYAALRADRLRFSQIPRVTGAAPSIPWDAPVDRLEAAAGYYLQRNVIARAGVQANWRDSGRGVRRVYLTGQLAWWF